MNPANFQRVRPVFTNPVFTIFSKAGILGDGWNPTT